jgi:hypothetical protein
MNYPARRVLKLPKDGSNVDEQHYSNHQTHTIKQ